MKKIAAILLLIMMFTTSCGEIVFKGDTVILTINAVPSTAGTVLSSGGDRVGNTAQFLAVPNPGWQFNGWTGDIESDENPLVIVLEDDLTLTANFSVLSNNYRFDLSLTDGLVTVDLAFGQIPGATDFFDSGSDREAPPPPPGKTLHGWFENDNRQLSRDFRNAFNSEVIWPLGIQAGAADSVWFNLSLQKTSLIGGLFLTNTDRTFGINLLEEDSFSLHIDDVEGLEIIYDSRF